MDNASKYNKVPPTSASWNDKEFSSSVDNAYWKAQYTKEFIEFIQTCEFFHLIETVEVDGATVTVKYNTEHATPKEIEEVKGNRESIDNEF